MGKGPGGKGRGPVTGRISSPYGSRRDPQSGKQKMHHGVDFAVARGTPIASTGAGKVVRAGWQNSKNHNQGYGQRVTIDHGNGNTSTYGHMDTISVKAGDTVHERQVIGTSGNTGKSTGPHVHYEERHNGESHPPTFKPAEYTPHPPHLSVDFV